MSRRPRAAPPVGGHHDVAAHFDACAASYREQHGDARRLLAYRLARIREAADFRADDVVLEIGCGNGLHLIALADDYASGLGIDLSQAMVEAARSRLAGTAHRHRISFAVDAAESLASVADASIDVAFCVGALEHVLDQAALFRSAWRVLKPAGRLVCLTPNGGSLWYRLAPALGFETRQLDSDRYLNRRQLADLVRGAGFAAVRLDYWTFVQRGDMPRGLAGLASLLDRLGSRLGIGLLRGGLRVRAVRPAL